MFPHIIHSFVLKTLFLTYVCLVKGDQQVLTPEARLRNATLDDANDISTVVIAAFEPLPDWQYLYQFRHAFPDGHRDCVSHGVKQMLADPNSITEVVEAPHGSGIPLVAVAIWRQILSPSHFFEAGAPLGCFQSLNVTRAKDYARKFNNAEKKHVFDVFGASQYYLHQLATHPDYQLRGTGTRLAVRGVEMGRHEGVNVTLISQPTAEGFYLKKGFREVQNITVESVDGDESFGYNVMAYDFDHNSMDGGV